MTKRRLFVLPAVVLMWVLNTADAHDTYGAAAWRRVATLEDCDSGSSKLLFDLTLQDFTCGTDATGSSGAPSAVNYLVGTEDVGLSDEIVVGTTPGGELGGTWASPTIDSGVVSLDEVGDFGCTGLQLVRRNTGDTAFECVSQNAGTDVTADLEEETHATEHQNGGADEIASATAANNAIVKAGGSGTIDVNWVPTTFATDAEVIAYAQPLGQSAEVSVVITSDQPTPAPVVVTGQTWVAAGSEIVCSPFGTTADGLTPEAIMVSEIKFVASDRVAGTGFTLHTYSPNGLEGTVRVHCLGT